MTSSRYPLGASRLGAIALGGSVGTLARYALGEAFPAATGAFPWTTFVINASGAVLLAMMIVLVTDRPSAWRHLQAFGAVGFCGSFTTYSAYATEGVLLVRDGRVALAAGYVAATLVTGIAGVLIGIRAARGLARRFA